MKEEERKILECAARAAGLNPLGSINGRFVVKNGPNPADDFDPYDWNPLTDDGDAFRLMVELRLNVFQAASCSCAVDEEAETETRVEGCNAEKVRHAITLAAARLGGYDK